MPIYGKTKISSSIPIEETAAEHAIRAKMPTHHSTWSENLPITRFEIEAPYAATGMLISANESTLTSRQLRPKNFPVGTPSEFIHVSESFAPDILGVTNHTEQQQRSRVQPFGTLKQTPATNKGVDAGNDEEEKVATESGTRRLYRLAMQMVQEMLDKGFGVDGHKVMAFRAGGGKDTIRRSRSAKQVMRTSSISRPRSRPSKNLSRRLSSKQQAALRPSSLRLNLRACTAPDTTKGKEKATPLQPLEFTSIMPYGIIIGQKSNTKVPILGSKASMKLLRVQDIYESKLPDGADKLLNWFVAFEPEKNCVYFMEDLDWDDVRSHRAESLVKAMVNGPANWLPVRKRSDMVGKNVDNIDKGRYVSNSSRDNTTSSDNRCTQLGINLKSFRSKLEHHRHKSLTNICEQDSSSDIETDYENDDIRNNTNNTTQKKNKRQRSNSSPGCENDMKPFAPYRRVLARIGTNWISRLNQIIYEDDAKNVIPSMIDDELDLNDEGTNDDGQDDSFQDLGGIFFLNSDAEFDPESDGLSTDFDFNPTSRRIAPEESFQPSSASEGLIARTFTTTRQTGDHIKEVIQRLRDSLTRQQIASAEIQTIESSRRNSVSRFERLVLNTQPSYISEAESVATVRGTLMPTRSPEKATEELTSGMTNDWCENEVDGSENGTRETGTTDFTSPRSTCRDTDSQWGDMSFDFSQQNDLEIDGDSEDAKNRVFSGTSTSSNESYQYDQNWW